MKTHTLRGQQSPHDTSSLNMAADHWHISQIGVQAFKSFGPSLVSFDVPNPQLVGIVGPNGCGKSNLLEVNEACVKQPLPTPTAAAWPTVVAVTWPSTASKATTLLLTATSILILIALQAICFATGGSPGTLRLTGRSLHDVTSTDAGSQVGQQTASGAAVGLPQ